MFCVARLSSNLTYVDTIWEILIFFKIDAKKNHFLEWSKTRFHLRIEFQFQLSCAFYVLCCKAEQQPLLVFLRNFIFPKNLLGTFFKKVWKILHESRLDSIQDSNFNLGIGCFCFARLSSNLTYLYTIWEILICSKKFCKI